MPHKQKFQVETEIPYELKKKGLGLDHANKWQKYYVEGCDKKMEGSRYYAWMKFRTNYRLRRDGWTQADGQWSVADKNEFADLLWGVWHACKRRHFPSEITWLDNFIKELIKIRNGLLVREESDEVAPLEAEELLAIPKPEEEEEELPLGAIPPPPAVEEDDGMDLNEEEEVSSEGGMIGGIPPAVEDDGKQVKTTKPKKALKRKKGKK